MLMCSLASYAYRYYHSYGIHYFSVPLGSFPIHLPYILAGYQYDTPVKAPNPPSMLARDTYLFSCAHDKRVVLSNLSTALPPPTILALPPSIHPTTSPKPPTKKKSTMLSLPLGLGVFACGMVAASFGVHP